MSISEIKWLVKVQLSGFPSGDGSDDSEKSQCKCDD
jgi:hypothetical protein